MGQRQDLQDLLTSLEGVNKAYFQAPSKDKREYPCIEYSIDTVDTIYADNNPYNKTLGYQVTVIDRDPDHGWAIADRVGSLPMSSFQRFFVVDGLNHFVYRLYF